MKPFFSFIFLLLWDLFLYGSDRACEQGFIRVDTSCDSTSILTEEDSTRSVALILDHDKIQYSRQLNQQQKTQFMNKDSCFVHYRRQCNSSDIFKKINFYLCRHNCSTCKIILTTDSTYVSWKISFDKANQVFVLKQIFTPPPSGLLTRDPEVMLDVVLSDNRKNISASWVVGAFALLFLVKKYRQ